MTRTIALLTGVEVELARTPAHFIDGTWVDPAAGGVLDVEDPSTGTRVAAAAAGTAQDVDAAVRAARQAFTSGVWTGAMRPRDRERCLRRLADLMRQDLEVLAQLDAIDSGKPLGKLIRADVPAAIDHVDYYAGWPTKLAGRTFPVHDQKMHAYSIREPVGVVGLITPWNYPLLMAMWKVAPALAAGNCVVLKPAEQTPLSARRLADLTREAGFPPGVFNVVTGDGPSAGAALVDHPMVDKIGFTGSVEVARSIVRSSAADLKRVSLELGGKSPNIIFADADLDAAVTGSLWAVFGNSGQSCTAGSRLYIQSSVYDEVVARLVDGASGLSTGPGMSVTEHDLGPLISAEQLARVTSWIDSATSAGAGAFGGRRLDGPLSEGYFLEPTVLVDTTDQLPAVREEIFGPVVAAMPFDDVDEVVGRANDSAYGLAAGLWTRDLGTAHEVSSRLQAGTVWVNSWGLTEAGVPFGGMKQSGHGREMGEEAFELYTETKSVWMGWT